MVAPFVFFIEQSDKVNILLKNKGVCQLLKQQQSLSMHQQ